MTTYLSNLTTDSEGKSSIVFMVLGEGATRSLVADQSHPNFEAIVAALSDFTTPPSTEYVTDLFDRSKKLAVSFLKVSERVIINNGHVLFDGDEIDNTLTDVILRFYDEGNEDLMALVNFLEKVNLNPQEHSRENLYTWMARHDFLIAPDGDFLAYKGVNLGPDYVSVHGGGAIVDGTPVSGYVPNVPGTEVTMPRSKVQFDPQRGCSTGLHVANWNYASGWGLTTMLVKINPCDVVSVPTECNWEKMRVCRYFVVKEVAEEQKGFFAPDVEDESKLPDWALVDWALAGWDGDEDDDWEGPGWDDEDEDWERRGWDDEDEDEDSLITDWENYGLADKDDRLEESEDSNEYRKTDFEALPFAALTKLVNQWGVSDKADTKSKKAYVKVLAKEAANRRHNVKRGYKAAGRKEAK